MKTFNWKIAYKTRNPLTVQWLETVYKLPLTEEEFVKQWMVLPHHSLRTSTTRAAKRYHYLKNTFGFFQ